MSNDAFVKASRRQLRFTTAKGHITTEDLWQLSLKDLDTIGQRVIAELKPASSSLLENPDPKANIAQQDNELRLEIIKEVIRIKQDENKAAVAASANRRRREILEDLLEKKKLGALEAKTIEEIEAELRSLG